MPEELENEQVTTETEETKVESKVEAEEEQRVPVSVVKELRDELRQAKEEGNLTRREMSKLMSDYQAALQKQEPKTPKAPKDPEVASLIDPYLEELREELRATKEKVSKFEESQGQSAAERYIEKNLPNLNEIREDILKEIQSYSQDEQKEVLANPREIVRIGKMLTKLKTGTTSSKSENRSRARAETGSTSTRLESGTDTDAKVQQWLERNKHNL
jgi:hypothetical protein